MTAPSGKAEGGAEKLLRAALEQMQPCKMNHVSTASLCSCPICGLRLRITAHLATAAANGQADCDTRNCQEYSDAACPGNPGGPCRMQPPAAANGPGEAVATVKGYGGCSGREFIGQTVDFKDIPVGTKLYAKPSPTEPEWLPMSGKYDGPLAESHEVMRGPDGKTWPAMLETVDVLVQRPRRKQADIARLWLNPDRTIQSSFPGGDAIRWRPLPPLYGASASTPQPGMVTVPREWISVADRLPEAGKRVETVYINSHGHQRRTLAHYAPKHTISASHWEDAETDDNEAGSFEPKGWWEDYAEAEYINALPDTVTHWRELDRLPPIDAALHSGGMEEITGDTQ